MNEPIEDSNRNDMEFQSQSSSFKKRRVERDSTRDSANNLPKIGTGAKMGRPKNISRPVHSSTPRTILPASPASLGATSVRDYSDSSSSHEGYVSSNSQQQPQYPHNPQTAFFHGPTNLPPQSYEGKSPMAVGGRLNRPRLDKSMVPHIEARLSRLEDALEHYVEQRAEQALNRATLPEIDDGENRGRF